jgi:hypothetical protein
MDLYFIAAAISLLVALVAAKDKYDLDCGSCGCGCLLPIALLSLTLVGGGVEVPSGASFDFSDAPEGAAMLVITYLGIIGRSMAGLVGDLAGHGGKKELPAKNALWLAPVSFTVFLIVTNSKDGALTVNFRNCAIAYSSGFLWDTALTAAKKYFGSDSEKPDKPTEPDKPDTADKPTPH